MVAGAVVLTTMWLMGKGAETPVLRAGVARGNITPELGAEMWSGFLPYPALNIHDDLWVRCLVLDDGKTRFALVVCDVLDMMWQVSEVARQRIERETGLAADNIMVSATHTHTAHDVMGDRFVTEPVLSAVQEILVSRIVDTVRRGISNLTPVHIGWTKTEAPEHVFNRRWYLKPETMPPDVFGKTNDLVKFNPGHQHPGLIKPAGPTDPQINVVAVRTLDGKPLGLFANYALHYVGGGTKATISADYYGMYNERMAQLLGADWQEPPFLSIMSNGTSGDINNVDFSKARPQQKPYEKMRYVAEDVAQKVAAAYKTIEWRDHVTLGAQTVKLTLEFRRPDTEQLAWADRTIKEHTPGTKPTWPTMYAERLLRMSAMPRTWEFPLQAFRIGDVGIAAFPNDTFVEVGLDLRKRSPFKQTFGISHANGFFGYLPTPEQHKLGGYEAWIGSSRLELEASCKMVDKLLEMLAQLKSL